MKLGNRRHVILGAFGLLIILAGCFHSLYYLIGFTRGWERDAWNMLQIFAGLMMAGLGVWIYRWRKRSFRGKALILLRIVQSAVILCGLGCVILLSAIWTTGRNGTPEETDYLMILGARVKGETVSLSLQNRLERGLEYLNRFPEARAVLSGGQGSGEDVSEAEAMKRYLVARGIPEGRLILEAKSTDTAENLRFSKEVLMAQGVDPGEVSVTLVTNDFHMLRAKMLAKRAGLQVSGYSSRTPEFTIPKAYTREIAAFIKSFVFDRQFGESSGGRE